MRAKNREINIFNMSLLDILTGMLGAFLFMMVGMVPYYAKVMQSKVLTAEEAKKFEELKKLLDQGLQGPLTPEQAQALRDELAALQARISTLESDLKTAQQELASEKDENSFWQEQNGRIIITAQWTSDATDVDIFVRGPKGTLFGPKKEKMFGRRVFDLSSDSHTADFRTNYEGIVVMLGFDGPGEYLVFYRVPNNADPATYGNLNGYYMYSETLDRKTTQVVQSSLGVSHATVAKPGGLYAWQVIIYDGEKHNVRNKPPENPLPDGILMPQ